MTSVYSKENNTVFINVVNRHKENAIDAEIINIHTIKPIDKEILIRSARKCKKIITYEEHNIIGGLGSAVAETLCEADLSGKIIFKSLGIRDKYCFEYGTREEVYKTCNLGPEQIVKQVMDLF